MSCSDIPSLPEDFNSCGGDFNKGGIIKSVFLVCDRCNGSGKIYDGFSICFKCRGCGGNEISVYESEQNKNYAGGYNYRCDLNNPNTEDIRSSQISETGINQMIVWLKHYENHNAYENAAIILDKILDNINIDSIL